MRAFYMHIGGDKDHPVQAYVLTPEELMKLPNGARRLGWVRFEAETMEAARDHAIDVAETMGWEEDK